MANHEGIVSSTGSPGIAVRGDNRIYCNWTHRPIRSASAITGMFRRLSHISEITRDGHTAIPEGRRDVFRGLALRSVVEELASTQANNDLPIETAFPVKGDVWYLGMARNNSSRQNIYTPEEIYQGTRENIRQFNPPLETINQVLREGYRFVTSFTPSDRQLQKSLFTLWHETFGWKMQQIEGLSHNLTEQDPKKPSFWFSALADPNGNLRAAATAELLEFAGENGEIIRLVESTEWSSTASNHIKAVADQMHAQILDAYPDAVIIAECNYHRGAHRAAQKSGMVSPDVVIGEHIIPQALIANVVVNDGKEPRGLRDFSVFTLPHNAISEKERKDILACTMLDDIYA